jgi:hypothetical protein
VLEEEFELEEDDDRWGWGVSGEGGVPFQKRPPSVPWARFGPMAFYFFLFFPFSFFCFSLFFCNFSKIDSNLFKAKQKIL